MMGGHRTDQIWFWDGKRYVTLKGRTDDIPKSVGRINARADRAIANPLRQDLPAQCRAYAKDVVLPGGKKVGQLPSRKAGDTIAFRASVDFDRATTDLAIGLLEDLRLGIGPATDLLTIGLSATDYVGHFFGTEGAEMCAQMAGLDANIARILSALDRRNLDYVVVLTSDHGGHDLPERNVTRGFPDAQRVDQALTSEAIGKEVAHELKLNIDGPLLHSDGPFGDWYVSGAFPRSIKSQVIALVRSKLLAYPQVAAVFSADDLKRIPNPNLPVEEWTLADRARASFDPVRSGDLVVLLKPHVMPIADPGLGVVATHGSPWIYDRRVPILFYRPGMTHFEQPLSVQTVDILPTLATLIGISIPPGEIDGRCLELDLGAVHSCAEDNQSQRSSRPAF
jgi:alkaline phosphatase